MYFWRAATLEKGRQFSLGGRAASLKSPVKNTLKLQGRIFYCIISLCGLTRLKKNGSPVSAYEVKLL